MKLFSCLAPHWWNHLPTSIRYTGPYLAPSAIDFVNDASIIPSLHSTQSGLFPPQTHVIKLRNDLALPEAVQRKRRRVPAQTFPGAILQFQKNNSATDHEKRSLKSMARCSDAINGLVLRISLTIVLFYLI